MDSASSFQTMSPFGGEAGRSKSAVSQQSLICQSTDIHIYIHVHLYTYITYMHACKHTYVHSYIYTYIHIYLRVYTIIHLYIYIHLVHIYIHIIHVHTHTYSLIFAFGAVAVLKKCGTPMLTLLEDSPPAPVGSMRCKLPTVQPQQLFYCPVP